MKSTFEKKMQRQHELSESCSASALQARLKVAAHEAEEESDNIAEDFLEGKMDIDDFLSSFMEKRTICHCRRAKEEKLQQVIAVHSQFHAPLYVTCILEDFPENMNCKERNETQN